MKRLALAGMLLATASVGWLLGPAWTSTADPHPGAASGSASAVSADPVHAASIELPDILTDDEPFDTQRRQMEIYTRHQSFDELWRKHMAPAMAHAAAEDGIDASDGLSEEELEIFRGQLIQFSTDLRVLIDTLPADMTLDADERLQQAEEAFGQMPSEDLIQVHDALKEYPGFWNTPSYALSLISEPGQVPFSGGAPKPGQPEVPDGRPTIPAVDPNSLQYENCAAYGVARTCNECPDIDEVAALSAAFALQVASLGVELTCEFLPDKILIGTVSVINVTTLICNGIRAGLDIAAASLAFAVEQHDECEEDYHLALMHLYLDESVMTRASEQSLDFHGLQELRLDIENNLLLEQDARISLFQMPESQGGFLDAGGTLSVRFVVLDTIETMEDLGYDVRNAMDEYNAAEDHLEDGEYKSAYARYRKAYRDAVRVGRELPAVPYPPSP